MPGINRGRKINLGEGAGGVTSDGGGAEVAVAGLVFAMRAGWCGEGGAGCLSGASPPFPSQRCTKPPPPFTVLSDDAELDVEAEVDAVE